VKRTRVVTATAEGGRQIVDLAACPREDECRRGILDIEKPTQCRQLVGPLHDVGDLANAGNAVAGILFRVDRDPDRCPEVTIGDPPDGRRDRRREEGRLPRRRYRAQNGLQILGEPHVEHLVRLVEDDDLDGVEPEAAAGQVIDGPARGRDDDVDAAPQAAELLADRLTAVDGKDTDAKVATIAGEGLGDLHRQLAGRDEHDGRCAAVRRTTDLERLQHRQGESSRLAGPGRGLGEQIPSGQQRRDRLTLDWRRLLVTELAERREQGRRQAQIGEGRWFCRWRVDACGSLDVGGDGRVGVGHLTRIVVHNGPSRRPEGVG